MLWVGRLMQHDDSPEVSETGFSQTPLCPPGDLPICNQTSGSLTLINCLLEDEGVAYKDLHLRNLTCRGRMDEETHMVTFSFDSTNRCGTEIKVN